MGKAKQLRLRFFRQLAHLAPRQPRTERRSLVEGELIAREVIRREGDGLRQSPPPDLERLVRQAVNQIDRDRFEARLPCDLDAASCLLRSMPPAEELQRVRIEGLDSERQEPDSEIPPGADALRGDVLGIGFEEDFGVLTDRKIFASSRKNPTEILRRQRGGRPAAKVNRIDRIKRGAFGRPEGNLRDEVIREPPPALRPAGEDREVTVGTDGGAEGEVEVEAGVGRKRSVQILPFQYLGRRLWWATAITRR